MDDVRLRLGRQRPLVVLSACVGLIVTVCVAGSIEASDARSFQASCVTEAEVAGPAGQQDATEGDGWQVYLPRLQRGEAPSSLVPTAAPTDAPSTPDATSTPGESPTAAPSPTSDVERPIGFAPYVPVAVDVQVDAPDYVPDLNRLTNARVINELTEDQKAKLASAGFVVVPAEHKQFYDLYVRLGGADTPAFVTTDALLHTYHVLHRHALRYLEQEVLIGEAQELTEAMLQASVAQHDQSPVEVNDAAFRNVAFFSVAARLLDPDAAIPSGVAEVVQAELALIDAHEGVARSPIFEYDEDYSQYVPRGHYNGTEELRRYFRTMMWFGRIGFRLDEDLPAEIRRRETRQALLMVAALHDTEIGERTALDAWDYIYDVTAFFVGTADDLTVYDYGDLAREVYGRLPTMADLVDEGALDGFIEEARELRPPAILNTPLKPGQDRQTATMGFRFMGQRYIPDSDIFQQLVYDDVKGEYRGSGQPFTEFDRVRSFPRGLDVPAALGSARALEILEADGDTDYGGYSEQLQKVQQQFGSLEPDRWTSNLYWSWLDSLRPLLAVRGEGFPYFMRSPQWTDKSLNTWLASWSQLRHDSILYAKPTMPGATGVPREPRGYVEPNPWLFARLAGLTAQMKNGLTERGLLDSSLSWRLADMEELCLNLKRISEKELEGTAITDDEFDAIRGVGMALQRIAKVTDDSPETDKQIAVVADVHTVPLAGQVLEEGVGDAFEIYVVVPEPDDDGLPGDAQIVTVGTVFSYYEFKWPMSDRLTDEAWQAMVARPPRPEWTESFMVEP